MKGAKFTGARVEIDGEGDEFGSQEVLILEFEKKVGKELQIIETVLQSDAEGNDVGWLQLPDSIAYAK